MSEHPSSQTPDTLDHEIEIDFELNPDWVLYQDDHIIVVNKPAGLLVHPSWIAPAKTPNLASMLKRYFNGGAVHPVHRLDRATSGVMVVARDPDSARYLQEQFANRETQKRYLCVVRGWAQEQGVIDYALKPIHDKIADSRANPDKEPKDAVSHFRCLAQVELPIPVGRYPAARYSLLEVEPKTGRKHQIRRHMKHILHPLVGDTKYGEGRHNRLFRDHLDCHRLLLMAVSLQFRHPLTQELVQFHAPLCNEMKALFSRLGWHQVVTSPAE